jgi:hypothetical protein
MITQQEVKHAFNYDKQTGKLFWRWRTDWPNNSNARFAHKEAGTVAVFNGGKLYYLVKFSNERFLAHKLIWLYLHGELPSEIDHKDGDGLNNREDNLRLATRSQNMMNKQAPNGGVEKHGRKYRARVKVEGRRIELGSFDTWDEAHQAYLAGTLKYFGEFAYIFRRSR